MTRTIEVNGMMCPRCEAHVKKALEAVDGITSAIPSHEKNNVVLEMTRNISDDVLRQAVTEAGYEFVK